MPMTAVAPAETAASPPASRLRRYELTTTGSSEALMRVIGLVRRRCGEVVALQYRVGDRSAPGCSAPAELPMARRATATATPPVLEIAVAIDDRQGPTLALRLAGLIDVVAVRER